MGTTGKLANIVGELESRIETARLVSGQRLIESDLTREFGISRALLREAFRQLAAEGAIDLVPNRGAEVRRLSRTNALELFEIRTELEGMAARRAAARMKNSAVKQSFEFATKCLFDDPQTSGALEYIAENVAFHRAVFVAAGNENLSDLTRKMRLPLIMSQLREALTPDVLATSLKEHRTITRAILAGDAALAESAIREHLIRATQFVSRAPDNLFRC
jgi:DNA-binding GntR family transcriptional regulator